MEKVSFWSTFFKKSLGNPWVISSQQEPQISSLQEGVPENEYIFLLSQKYETEKNRELLHKMGAAIGLGPNDMSCCFVDAQFSIEDLIRSWPGSQQIFVFGNLLAQKKRGIFYQESTKKIMVTHDLSGIQSNLNLKKECWLHLQKFAGIK